MFNALIIVGIEHAIYLRIRTACGASKTSIATPARQ